MSTPSHVTHALVDGLLALEVEDRVASLVQAWIPRNSILAAADAAFAARIAVVVSGQRDVRGRTTVTVDTGSRPALTLDGVKLWITGDHGVMRGAVASAAPVPGLANASNASTVAAADDVSVATGRLDLESGRALITVPASGPASDAYSMLTIASALLLLRQECALVHAGAVVASDGGAWLLVGDTHSGKSTTCLNLLRGGCRYLADDQVVLRAGNGSSIFVSGWQRDFHLDEGWHEGDRIGCRGTIDPFEFSPETPREAPIAGVLLLSIAAAAPTRLTKAASSEALAGIVRQTPWFLLDRPIAARALKLLSRVALLPTYALSVGLDVYTDANRLMEVVSPALGAGSRAIAAATAR